MGGRVNSCEAVNRYSRLFSPERHHSGPGLAQANHVFWGLDIIPNNDDYWASTLPGYLFLCPLEDLRSGPDISTGVQMPECPAHWSLDPSCAERLSADETEQLGFLPIHIFMLVHGVCWDHEIYDGLDQFHHGKGLDPWTHDVARHLGYPLFRFTSKLDARSSNVDTDDNSFVDEEFSASNSNEVEMPTPSWRWQIIMSMQLALILFLAASSLYGHLDASPSHS
ncbi:hypothetical protein DFH09DRAFT_1077846 [Mycena vulgaris]|nr:hypothetical protein DFH09DRAFT_1077846 [Mycena vulgaris]